MRKPLKIAGIAVTVIVSLIIGLIILAKIVITPELVKKTVLPLAEKALHRQVQLGEIKVSIFSGIVLKELLIREKEGSGAFIKAEQVKLSYRFWPLLSKRVVVDEVRLDAPQIRVIRMPDGTFNYSDITAKKEPAAPEAKPKTKADINLLVSKVALTKGQVFYEDRSGKLGPPFQYTISDIEFSSSDIALDKPFPFSGKAKFTGASVEVEGKVADVSAKPAIDAVIRVVNADLKKIAAGLPPGLTAKAKSFDPAGVVNSRFHLTGPIAKPKELLKDGEVRLENVQVTASGQRPSLTGKLALKGDSASSQNLVLALGDSKLQIEFTASNLFGKPISVASNLKSDRFDLDPFLKKGKTAPATGAAAVSKPEPGPLKLPVRANGTMKLGQTSYKGLPITQLFLKYRLIDNVLTIDELKGNVAGGSFSDTARIDLGQKGFVYSTRLKVQGVQANPAVSAFAPKAAGTVFGALSFDTELSGKGTQLPTIKKNLNARGDFNIAEGKLTGAGLVQGFAQYLNLEQLRVLQFNKFAGSFRIEKGKVILDSGVTGKDLQITPKGSAGLDKSLDLSLVARLSPELTGRVARGDIGKLLTDDKGWGILPLKVGGTVSSPKFRLDPSAVREQVKTKTKERLQQTIEEKLLKKKEGEPQRPEQNILEKGLRGIFGK